MLGKNLLLDAEQEINKQIEYINKRNETVIGIEMNEFTLKSLKENGIYGIKEIHIIRNNNLNNFEIKFNTEKNSKSTEYVPYK